MSNISNHLPIDDDYIVVFVMQGCIDGTITVLGATANIVALFRLSQSNMGKVTLFTLRVLSVLDASCLVLYFTSSVWPHIFVIIGKQYMIHNVATYTTAYVYPFVIMASNASTWITVMICHHRYIAVFKPMNAASIITMSKVKLQTVVIIVYSIIITSPRLMERTIYMEDNGFLSLKFASYWYNPVYRGLYKIAIMLVVNKVLPLVYMSIASGLLIHEVLKQYKTIVPMRDIHNTGRDIVQKQRKITCTLMSVVVLYVLTNLPIILNSIPTMFYKSSNITLYIMNSLLISNSALNVVIYYPYTSKIRNIFCP